MRRLLARAVPLAAVPLVAVLLVAVVMLAACGGGGGADGPPKDAAKQDFCHQAVRLLQARSGQDVRDWAAGMEEAGTPTGITASQRRGFERAVELASRSRGDGPADGLGELDPASEDGRAVLAFIGYAQNTCPDSFEDALPTPSQ